MTDASTLSRTTRPAHTDRHPQWLAEWRQAREDVEMTARGPESGNGDNPAEKEAWDRMQAAAKKIVLAPADTAVGLSAKMDYLIEEGYGTNHAIDADARCVLQDIQRGLAEMADDISKADGYVGDRRSLSVAGRIHLLCEWFELTLPEIRYGEGEEECDGAILMTDELIEWVRVSGVSMDWVFSGNAKGMCELMRMIVQLSDKKREAA